MNTVLLTGAAGFIGFHTVKQLLARGIEVVGVDNLNDYYDVRLKQYRLKQLGNVPGFHFHQVDIEDVDSLDAIVASRRFDAVLNLAARAGVRYSLENPRIYMTTNAIGHLNLLELAVKYSIPKVVLASTSSLYAGQPLPFKEDLPVNTPISPYAASKKAAEVISYTYHYLYDLDISVVRYFTVYGPASRPDMCIFRFIRWIDEGTPIELYGDGNQSRDFTYVDDIAAGTIAATRKIGFEIINLGGGMEPVTLKVLIQRIEEMVGKRAIIRNKPFHKADVSDTQASIEKAASLIGWAPATKFLDGLERTVHWYRENREFAKSIAL